jgi:hypothetical protein
MWILDFDCCRDISLDEAGVQQAGSAFRKTYPFYPRPGRDNDRDQVLWEQFKAHFLETSATILGSQIPEAGLPGLWVGMPEKQAGARHNPIVPDNH